MGAPLLKVDWQAVRETWLLTESFSETARIHGIKDSAAIRVRAGREGWQKTKQAAIDRVTATGVTVTPARAVLRPVTTADVIQDELHALGADGRLYAARVGVGVLRHHAGVLEADPEAVSARIDEAVGATRLLQNGNVPGWERQAEQSKSQVLVQVGVLGLPAEAVLVETPREDPS